VRHARRAIELTPFDPFLFYYDNVVGLANLVAGNTDHAITYLRKSLRENARFSTTHRLLAIAYV